MWNIRKNIGKKTKRKKTQVQISPQVCDTIFVRYLQCTASNEKVKGFLDYIEEGSPEKIEVVSIRKEPSKSTSIKYGGVN